MGETILLVFEFLGVFSAAISGAMTGIRKHMDLFGVCVLGVLASMGGGVIRDLILGQTPPLMFRNPMYSVVALCSSLLICLPPVLRLISRRQKGYDMVMLVMDSLGLGAFTVVGISVAQSCGSTDNQFLTVFVGVVTGVGGGVLRDLCARDLPYIFVKHFYACASVCGALVCYWLLPVSRLLAMLCGLAVVTVLRLLAARFRWSLPHPGLPEAFHGNGKAEAGAEDLREAEAELAQK